MPNQASNGTKIMVVEADFPSGRINEMVY